MHLTSASSNGLYMLHRLLSKPNLLQLHERSLAYGIGQGSRRCISLLPHPTGCPRSTVIGSCIEAFVPFGLASASGTSSGTTDVYLG